VALHQRPQILLLVISILLPSLPVTAGTPASRPLVVLVASETEDTFEFGKVDLDLLSEIQLLDERLEKEGVVYREPTLDAYLDRVGNALVAGQEIENVKWKFRALRDPAPNAFALPNGSIYINTGLLALLEDEGQVAAVLAHEVTHVSKRHTYLQNRSLRKKVLAINILNTIGAWTPVGGPAGLAIDLIASISPLMLALSVFGYSRELEKEADTEGLKTMTAAGYAPEEMVNSFKALQKDIEGEQLSSFYNDHPKLQDRVSYTSSAIPATAKRLSEEEAKNSKADYSAEMEAVDRHDVELALNESRFRSAVFVSQKLVDSHPDSSENIFYLAESYRMLGPRDPVLTSKDLTSGAKKKAAKKLDKKTFEELEAELMKTPAGQEAWKVNQEKAEKLYLDALELNRFNAAAHRGLGMLYEKVGKQNLAASEYAKYLELAPNAIDTERIRRRLTVLRQSMN
jgi:beta-barrel assembly-enhancing protease